MSALLSAIGAVLLFLLKFVGVLLLIIIILAAVLLLCPFCADISWRGGVLTIKAGVFGLTFPVFVYPKPEPPAQPEQPKGFFGRLKAKFKAWREEQKRKKAAKKPKPKKKQAAPRKKAKLTVDIVCTMLRGAGRLIKAVFGALRITKINIVLGVRGEDPAEAARSYGRLNAWLYTALGVLDRFIYLDFERIRIVPDFGGAQPSVEDSVSLRVSARALFIVIAAVRVLYEFWREKVLDVFL